MVNFKRDPGAIKAPMAFSHDGLDDDFRELTSLITDAVVPLIPRHKQATVYDEDTGEEIIFDHTARETICRMLETVPDLERPFVFYTPARYGKLRLQAMRTDLARVRANADEQGLSLPHFKLFLSSIERHVLYDKVTVVRSRNSSLKQKRALDGIMTLLAAQKNEEDGANE